MRFPRLDVAPLAAIVTGTLVGGFVTAVVLQRSAHVDHDVHVVRHEHVQATEAEDASVSITVETAPTVTVVPPATSLKIRSRGAVGPLDVESEGDPLVYVDGVRAASGTEVIGTFTPADIDRIEIIKGEAAISLYGPEAKYGVVMIFLKKGEGDEGR